MKSYPFRTCCTARGLYIWLAGHRWRSNCQMLRSFHIQAHHNADRPYMHLRLAPPRAYSAQCRRSRYRGLRGPVCPQQHLARRYRTWSFHQEPPTDQTPHCYSYKRAVCQTFGLIRLSPQCHTSLILRYPNRLDWQRPI